MTVYADTSVIGAVIFDEPESERARDFFRRTRARVIVSDLARLEFAAVVSRLVRTGKFGADQSARALAGFGTRRRIRREISLLSAEQGISVPCSAETIPCSAG